MTIQFGWGWRIALLYASFVAMMLTLVISSNKQKFDLVSQDYYKDEIAYQNVLDASKNQASLAGTLVIHGNDRVIAIDFPGEFAGKSILGTIHFYSAVNKEWDRDFPIKTTHNSMGIDRSLLYPTGYTIKLSYSVDGKNYYQENELNLSK